MNNKFELETQRTLLALSNGRKLITNNKSIQNENYYSVDNIFILGLDDEKLIEFLNRPFKPIPLEVMNYYNIEEWVERFLLEENS